MAGLRKDVDLIFRGEDRASPTIKSVRKSVADLTNAVDEQIQAASRGEGSIDSLAQAFRKLKDAQGDINEIVKLATAYEKQTAALAAQNAKVDEAKAKQEQLNAQVAAAEAPTKRLLNARDAAERQLAGAIQKQQQLEAAVRETGAALDAAGGDSKDFAATQDRIRQAAIETARALRDAGAAMDQFKGKQASGKANVAAAAEMEQFNKLAAGSGLPQAQINFISTLENKLQALQAAITEDQASMARLNAELDGRNASNAAGRIAAIKTALDDADQSAQRLAATAGFRQMAQEIEAGARDISRFGAQADTTAQSTQRFADTIQAILNPTQAASASLEGINGVLAQAETITDGTKRRLSEYNAELNNLQSAAAGISAISKSIDDFQQQETAVAGAKAAMEQAQSEVLRLSQAIRTAEAPTQEMANSLKQAQANLENAGRSFQTETAKLNTMGAALTKAGVDTRNLGAAQAQLTTQAQRLAAAQAKVTAKTTGKGNLFGLNPNEMQNLGFQINDIVVSIASGQNPMRVMLQQGAQIGQIIPGAFSAILRFAGPLAALTAVVVTFGAAMKKASDDARRLEEGAGIVAQLGNGTDTSAAQFADLAAQLENAGVKAGDARKALVELASDGLTTEQMQAYLDTAKAVAEVTGVDLKDALEQVRSSFQGGMEDILNLQEETGAYSDAELDLIQKLYDQGKADEARTTALQIYRDNQQDVANRQRGEWSVAADQLSQAWQRFLGWLNTDGPFKNVQTNLSNLARGAAFTAALINEISKGNFSGAVAAAAKTATADLRMPKPAAKPKPQGTVAGRRQAEEDALALQAAKAHTRAEKEALVVAKARHEAAAKQLNDTEIQAHVEAALATFRATEDQKDAKRGAAAAKRQAAAARAAANRAKAEQNRIDSASESIQRAVDQLDASVDKKGGASLEAKLRAIDEQYAKLFRDIDKFSQQTNGKGLIGGQTIAQVREHIEAQKVILKGYAQLEDSEKRIKDLEEQRKAKLDEIADKVARGIISPEDGLNQSNAVIDDMAPKIAAIASDALVFAQAFAKAHPSPEMDAFIAKMQAAIQNNSGGQNARAKNDIAEAAVDEQMSALNKLVAQRNALVEHENNLVQAGLESYTDAQKKIQGFYNDTNGLIKDQIALILRLADSWKTGTPEQQRAFAALSANLATVGQEAQGTDASFVSLKNSVTQILTTNIVGFIDSVAQAFAKLADSKDVLGFLADVGRAFLTMIANILQTVATLIIEALVLDAVDKATGGILKPLLKMTAAAASFHHEGGIAGSSKRTRNVSPLAFAGAPSYHTGGIAGLAPNETTAILKRGEEVLTEDDPRHRFNGGLSPSGPSAPSGIRQILAIGDDEIAGAMAGVAGEKTVITHIRRNRASIKQMLDS